MPAASASVHTAQEQHDLEDLLKLAALLRVGLCGALGGATNAWLCYAQIPVALEQDFRWHVVPAGAIHGGLLALSAFGLGMLLLKQTLGVRLVAAPLIAWTAGFVSWMPLNASIFNDPWSKTLAWPFYEGTTVVGPFMYFGLVTLVYYLCLVLFCARRRSLGVHVLLASASGVLGSLWWWSAWNYWYLSLLHGAVWGACVGAGAWWALRSDLEK
jgi:hypothetical protein